MAESKYLHLIDRYFFEETDKIKWDNLLMIMPPKFDKRVWEKYDMLNENERKLCILLFFDVSCKDIADILPYTQNSVHAVTYRIKQKTGMGNIKTNLKELLFPEKTG
jgi:DNA-directed RNA polymerase specialized sigma subunit